MKQILAAVGVPLTLAVLSGVTAELLLGDQYLMGSTGLGQQLLMTAGFVLFYGSAAVIIREVTRRTGRGWPTILLLGLAFGLFEEGLITQTLWNPHYFGFDLLSYGHLPGLGTAAPWLIFVLGLHTVWSISTPIAVAEALFSRGARVPGRPWLSRRALAVPVLGLLVGSLGTAWFTWMLNDRFVAHWWQFGLAGLAAAFAGVAAFTLTPTRRRPPVPSSSGRIAGSAAFAFVVSSGFQLAMQPEHWSAGVAVTVQLLAVLAAVAGVRVLGLAPFGLAVGALITYGWVGMLAAARTGTSAVVEQSVLLLIMTGVVALAWRRSRPQRAVTLADRADALPVPASLTAATRIS